MRRILHVPVVDLREGDKVSSPGGSSEAESRPYQELIVTESRWCVDNDGTYYIGFDDDRWSKFCDPFTQFTLILEL